MSHGKEIPVTISVVVESKKASKNRHQVWQAASSEKRSAYDGVCRERSNRNFAREEPTLLIG